MSNDRQAAASDKTGGSDAARLPIPDSRLSLAASPFAKELIPQDLARTIASQIPTTNLKNAMTQVAAAISIQQKDTINGLAEATRNISLSSSLQKALKEYDQYAVGSSARNLKAFREMISHTTIQDDHWKNLAQTALGTWQKTFLDQDRLGTLLPSFAAISQTYLANIQKLQSSIAFASSQVTETIKHLLDPTLCEILDESQWPLYLVVVDKPELKRALLNDYSMLLDPEANRDVTDQVECLRAMVYERAREFLDDAWVTDTGVEWESSDAVSEGMTHMGLIALDLHRKREYAGCVAILMSLLDGLANQLGKELGQLTPEEIDKHNNKAKRYNLREISSTQQRIPPKSYFLLDLLRLTGEGKSFYWTRFTSYLIKTVETNNKDGLEEHNPLRNKICHGDQTNYNTWEHSVKAILSFDMVVHLISTTHHLKDADMPSETDMAPSPAAS